MEELRGAFERLRASPSDDEAWAGISLVINADNKARLVAFLKENPPVLRKFMSMVQADPDVVSTFYLTLDDMDSLEPFISGHLPGQDAIRKDSSPGSLDGLDKELEELLGNDDGVQFKTDGGDEDARKTIEDDLLDIEGDKKSAQDNMNRYNDLIKQTQALSYSFNEADLDRIIALYEEALSLKDDQAIDWYNLGQAYLKRAQKKVGVFTYGFEGSYKDPTDFYNALDTSKKAVLLDTNDRVYWENLATIYEIVNKKPLALFCVKHSLNMLQEQEKRLKDSGLVGSTSLNADMIVFMQNKIQQLQKDVSSEIDPFDETAVFEYEKKARADKISKRLPLNHVELISEAYEQQGQGNLDGTISMLKKAVEIKPDFFEAWVLLADLSNQLAMASPDIEQRSFSFSDALRYTNEAIKINAESIEPYKILAQQYDFLGARDDYIRMLTKITELEPGNWEYKKKLADVYREKGVNFHIYGDAIQARSYFVRAIEIYPYDHVTWKWAGKNHVLLGQLAPAIEAYNESIRLDETDASTKEGLVEALFLQAENFYEQGLIDETLVNIRKIDALVSGHAKAMALFDEIVEGLCDSGYEAFEDADDARARYVFEKVLTIQPGYPFALFGLAKVHLKNGNHGASLDNALLSLDEWCDEIMRYADEFILRELMDYFNSILFVAHVDLVKIGDASSKFKQLLDAFMNLATLIHDNHVRFGEFYVAVFSFLLDITCESIQNNGKDAVVVFLKPFSASDLVSREHAIQDWTGTKNTADAAIQSERHLVLKDLTYFLDKLYELFLYRNDIKRNENILVFINFMLKGLSLTMKELYETFSYTSQGDHVIKAFDNLATATYSTRIPLRSTDMSVVKVPKPLVALVPHPSLNLLGLVGADARLSFSDKSFNAIESAVYSGKVSKYKAGEFKWSPNGTRGLIAEHKEGKGMLKALMKRANNLILVDFSHDPMVVPGSQAFEIDPSELENLVKTWEIEQDVLAVGWKDDSTFHALLGDGMLIRWVPVDGDFQRRATQFPLGEGDLLSAAPDQTTIAIVKASDASATLVDLRSDRVIKKQIDKDIKPLFLAWDEKSTAVHLLGKHPDDAFAFSRIAWEDQAVTVTGTKDAGTIDFFEATSKGVLSFFLAKVGNKLYFLDSSGMLHLEFTIELDAQSVLERGIARVQWMKPSDLRLFMNEPVIARLDVTRKLRQVIDDRITFLEQFPRQIFLDKANELRKMAELLV